MTKDNPSVISNCVLLTEIPYSASKLQVIKALQLLLHSPEFSIAKINFDFQFIFGKANVHVGKGILTLPERNHVFKLLSNNFQVQIEGKRIQFLADARPPANYELVVERIKNEPWADTTMEEASMDELIATHRPVVSVDYLHFGRYCWDSVFSLEYEWKAKLYVKSEHGDILLAPQDELRERVVIKPWTIKEMCVDIRQNIVMLLLNLPVTYQGAISNAMYFADRSKEIRPKAACIAPDHEEIAPFVSNGLTLWFKNPKDLQTFLMFSDRLHIRPKKRDLYFEIRNLYSGKRLETVKDWLRSLPLALAFQCELLLRSLIIDPSELLTIRTQLDEIFSKFKVEECLSFLLEFRKELENGRMYNFEDSSSDLFECFERARNDSHSFRPLKYSEQLIQCFQIVVTPTTFYLDGPFADQANRVLRLFPNFRNHFVRVSFGDEEHMSLRFNREEDKESYVSSRIVHLLKNGIQLYHGKYEFLGYSSSGLREHSVYFVHPFTWKGKYVNAEKIRNILGDFTKEIHYPARYGARLAQAFTTTRATVRILPEQLKEIPDVVHKGSNFTDGVGVMSKPLADKIFAKLGTFNGGDSSVTPSAYQIRLGGLKGVVSVNTDLPGVQLLWRPSMKKFEADHFRDFEVARAFTKAGRVTLNRPLIKILEDLGIPLTVFVELQDEAIRRTNSSFENINDLGNLLENHGLGFSFQLRQLFDRIYRLLNLNSSDLLSDSYATLPSVFQTAVNHSLRDMKYSSKIPVPDSYCLVGIADEFNYLKPHEVYACVYDPTAKETTYIEGPVCVYRSPTLHPGDVQMVQAIGKIPENVKLGLRDVKNALVFSVHPDSPRSLPSCLGGGDLDGDEYCILVNPKLHPRKRAKASAYEPAEKNRTPHACTINDVADFVGNYILSDMLGMIATRHLMLADMSPFGTCDPGCIKLAELASHAVDFPKSGTPVLPSEIPKLPEEKRPDYLAPEVIGRGSSGKYYPSQRAIGVLYRSIDISEKKAVSLALVSKKLQYLKVTDSFDPKSDPITIALLKLEMAPWFGLSTNLTAKQRQYARDLITRYNKEFIYIAKTNSMIRGKVLTESEVLVCSIMDPSRQPRKRKSLMNTMRVQTQELFRRMENELESPDILQSIQNCWFVWVVSRQAKAYGTESIGSGSGSKITRPAAGLGKRTAIIEKGCLGGTCLNHGCIPSKMLIHPADILAEIQEINKLNIHGIDPLIASIDKKSLVDRVCDDIDSDSNSIEPLYQKNPNITLFRGEAKFTGPKVIQVNGRTITADLIFIVAGCRARIPQIPGLDGTPFLTYKEVLRLREVPKSMVIIGGGYIACELGYFLQKSGTSVEFVVRNRMLSGEDPEIQNEFEQVFARNHKIHFQAVPKKVEYIDGVFFIHVQTKEKEKILKADSLFIATGVTPNSDLLDVNACGVETSHDGFILVDPFLQTNVPGVYAYGDIIGKDLFKHKANYEGEYLFKTIFKGQKLDGIVYPPIPHAVFSNPQIGSVGYTEPQAREKYSNIVVGRCDYDEVAMGNAMLADHGFAKLIFEKESRRLLGAHIIGKEASNLIHMCIAYLKMGATLDDMIDTIYIHPALAEVIRNACWNAKKNI